MIRIAVTVLGCGRNWRRFAGPDNFCPVLVGSLGGALFGLSATLRHVSHVRSEVSEADAEAAQTGADLGFLWEDPSGPSTSFAGLGTLVLGKLSNLWVSIGLLFFTKGWMRCSFGGEIHISLPPERFAQHSGKIQA